MTDLKPCQCKCKPASDWRPIDELPFNPASLLLYVKNNLGRNIYLPAKVLDANAEGICLIATEGGVSSFKTIMEIYTHFAEITPPKS